MDTTFNPPPGDTGQSVPPMSPPDKVSIRPIRTYESDTADVLRSQNASLIKIAIAEDTRRQEIPTVTEEQGEQVDGSLTKKSLMVLLSLVLLAGGAGVLYYIYSTSQKNTAEKASLALTSIIPYQKAFEINIPIENLTRDAFIAKINQEIKNSKSLDGSIGYIHTTINGSSGKEILSTEKLLSILNTSASSEFSRSLDPQHMFGIIGTTKNSPFLILKTNFYQNGFVGMLAWEKTLADDFEGLLTNTPLVESTTTPKNSSDLLRPEQKFTHIVMQNQDVRVLRDSLGTTRIVYSFIDNNTIVIAPDELALLGIINIANKKRFLR